MPVPDFRLLTRAKPELIDAALEAHEQALDKAEAVILKSLMSEVPQVAFEAAKTMLRFSATARKRGWYDRVRPRKEDPPAPEAVSFRWLDQKAVKG